MERIVDKDLRYNCIREEKERAYLPHITTLTKKLMERIVDKIRG